MISDYDLREIDCQSVKKKKEENEILEKWGRCLDS